MARFIFRASSLFDVGDQLPVETLGSERLPLSEALFKGWERAVAVRYGGQSHPPRVARSLFRLGPSAGAIMALAACVTVSPGCAKDGVIVPVDAAVVAVLRGTVLDNTEKPVAGAIVTASAYDDPDCVNAANPVSFPSVTSRSDGHYNSVLVIPVGVPFLGCLNLEVAPPPGGNLQQATLSVPNVHFDREGATPDTIVADFRLLTR